MFTSSAAGKKFAERVISLFIQFVFRVGNWIQRSNYKQFKCEDESSRFNTIFFFVCVHQNTFIYQCLPFGLLTVN